MKKLYYEYFHISEQGKIRDKVMLVRVAFTVVVMLLCLAAMSFSAYAYFSDNVTSAPNIIRSADFDVIVTVSPEPESPEPEKEGDRYVLNGGQSYSVQLEKSGSASTGFCVVEVTVGTETVKYHTQQLGAGGVDESLRFTLDLSLIPDTDTIQVKFTPHWGTSRFYGYDVVNDYYIQDNDTVSISAVNRIELLEQPDEKEDIEPPSDPIIDVEPEPGEPAEVVYTIVYGDTLGEIAQAYGVTVERLAAYNNIEDPNKIRVGKDLKIPPPDWEIPVDDTE